MVGRINRGFLFQQIRGILFGGRLSQKQVEGIDLILDHWEQSYAERDDRWLAYILATTFHEAARTMQPISEFGSNQYFTLMYDPPPAGKRPSVARQLGNNEPGDGPRFKGRGYVQITGRRNYSQWSARLRSSNADLISNPDLALVPKFALRIMFEGMMEGTFTGKKLSDYFNKSKEDWIGARKIVNGNDKDHQIAHYARTYYAALSYTTGT